MQIASPAAWLFAAGTVAEQAASSFSCGASLTSALAGSASRLPVDLADQAWRCLASQARHIF